MPTPVDLAKQELAQGVKEPEAYARYTGGRDEAWCAHFVSWLFRTAGFPLPGSTVPTPQKGSPTAGCNYIAKRMTEAGRVLPPGAVPEPNDIILYKHAGPTTGSFESPGYHGLPFVYGHIGLVESVVEENGVKKVITLEGNYSNKVARVKTRLDSPTIGLFARPVGAVKSLAELQASLLRLQESEAALVDAAAKAPTEASRRALQTSIDQVRQQIETVKAQMGEAANASDSGSAFVPGSPVGPILIAAGAAALAVFALKRRS